MLNDFQIIDAKLDTLDEVRLYPIGDVHIGSKECDLDHFREFTKMIANDPCARVVIIGDMMNMGLKNSLSNVYEETLSPMEQKEVCYELLEPIKDKIIGGCSGNHEYRMVKEVGTNPLYDVFCRLHIEDKYRENVCFMKLSVGSYRGRPNTYGVVLTHGKSKKKDADWTYAVDGADVFISGHTHLGTHQPMSKIRMDLIHNNVKTVDYQHIVVLPWQQYGGYAVRNKYLPNTTGYYQCITFDGTTKKVRYSYV